MCKILKDSTGYYITAFEMNSELNYSYLNEVNLGILSNKTFSSIAVDDVNCFKKFYAVDILRIQPKFTTDIKRNLFSEMKVRLITYIKNKEDAKYFNDKVNEVVSIKFEILHERLLKLEDKKTLLQKIKNLFKSK